MLFKSIFTVAGALASLSSAATTNNCPGGTADTGYYKGNGPCTQCPNGFTTAGSGATEPSQCNVCPAGSYIQSSTCTVCPIGQYSTTSGSTYCSVCPDGQTTTGVGSTSQTQCNSCTPG
ncbi:hypothetical protein FRB98_008718 [Tulasnella sp. 332]|nr:hypothetical protein FRB98_008718 [Tulasnella sp. 332]